MSYWQIILAVAGAVLVLWAIVRAGIEQRRAKNESERREEQQRDYLRARGELLPDGVTAACVVCRRQPATECWPTIGQSWMDRDLLGHRKLHRQAPMYVVRDAFDSGPQLCLAHKRMVVRKLEEKLGEVSARRAAFNSAIEDELAQLESSGLLIWARTEAEGALQSVLRSVSMTDVRMLPAPDSNREAPAMTVTLTPADPEANWKDEEK